MIYLIYKSLNKNKKVNSADRFRQIYFLLSIAGISIVLTVSIFMTVAN